MTQRALWRPVPKLSGSLDALRGPAVTELPVETALQRWRAGRPLVELRPLANVARSGGSFSARKMATLEEWQRGVGHSLVFDTRRRSEVHQLLSLSTLPEAQPLRFWSRSPVATLGRPRGVGQENEDGNGLAFHRHERNWLLLLTGTKRWYFHGGTPVTALQRVSEESLIKAEVEAATAGELQSHEQKPGECMLIPDGYWHCTYNDPAEQDMTFGVGGMGRFHSEVEALCAFGFLAELRQTKREELSCCVQPPSRISFKCCNVSARCWVWMPCIRLCLRPVPQPCTWPPVAAPWRCWNG